MPKITLTAEEEIQYIRELDAIRELMPDMEIQIISEPLPLSRYDIVDSTYGDEFKTFLLAKSKINTESSDK